MLTRRAKAYSSSCSVA